MDESNDASTTPSLTITPSQVKRDIRDFFSRAEPPAKKTLQRKKITSENGRVLALRFPPAKKVKRESSEKSLLAVSGAGVRSSRAKLRLLVSIPLDILFEIFSHLMPLDILRLSRTTKELRRLLLHRSATGVWKAALNSVPKLPACPDNVSLPFWTNLVFDSHCQNCLTTNVKKFNFHLRIRLCNRCSKTRLLPESNFKAETKENKLILNCIPFSHWNGSFEKFCTVADHDQFVEEMKTEPLVTSFVVEKQRVLMERMAHTRLCKAWFKAAEFEREQELGDIRERRAEFIRDKLVDMGYEPELEFLDDLELNICSIVPRPDIHCFYDHPLVRQSKPLTEKSWLNIKNDMEEYMRSATQLRLQNARCALIDKRRRIVHGRYNAWKMRPENIALFPPHLPLPNAADVFNFCSLKSIARLPEDNETYFYKRLDEYFAQDIKSDIRTWRSDCVHNLAMQAAHSRALAAVPLPFRSFFFWSGEDNYPQEKAFLERAVVVFRCTNRYTHWKYEEKRLRMDVVYPPGTDVNEAVREASFMETHAPIMWFPQFLHHICTSTGDRVYEERLFDKSRTLCTGKHLAATKQVPWNQDTLDFDEKASRIVRNILEACGMDWKTTTTKQLNVRDPRLVCMKCTWGNRCDGERIVRVWSWRDAVQHCISAHFGNGLVTWECISEEDTIAARSLEAVERKRRNFHPEAAQKQWRCMQCRFTHDDCGRMSWASLQEHFSNNRDHGAIEQMAGKEDIWYYRDMDSFPPEGPPVKMKPSAVSTPPFEASSELMSD